MAEPTPDLTDRPDSPPDATLMPASGSGDRDGHDVTLVRTPGSEAKLPFGSADVCEVRPGVGGYDLLDELGRGGMGVVYKARCRALHRLVALKMVLAGSHARPEDLARFRAEAEVVARLQHPNIVQIFEIGEQSGRPYLALELVAGGTLQKTFAGTPQPTRAAAHLVELLARAVHFAHQCGVIHRDLKPGNVLLAVPPVGASSISDQDAAQVAALYGVPKVTDFGLAKRLEDDAQQTRSGDILGTPSYMAPEQAGGQAFTAGPAADVYALGAILYDALTGRPPFKGATTFETIQQVLNEPPVPPGRLRPRLPKDLERICLKCLEKDPRRRYASALDLASDLRRHLNGEAVHVRSAPPTERMWRWARRNPVPTGLLLALTLGAVIGFWQLSRLSESLVRTTALEGAVQQAETISELNRYYSKVVDHLRDSGVNGETNWATPGAPTMPPPATMTIELGKQITARSESGMQVRLYSDYPFKSRMNRPPPDDFEREALAQLRNDPKRPFYRFEDLDGRPVLRYATARVMEKGCVTCHNGHSERMPDWPVWKEGDVRGVLEIIRPLDRDQERVRSGLRGTVLLVTGSGASLLGLSVFLIYLGNRRSRMALVRHAHLETNANPAVASPQPESPPVAPPNVPNASDPTAVSAATVPEEPVVVWQVSRPIGSLTPVRLVTPSDGTLRLFFAAEGETGEAELRVEVTGGATASDWGISPRVEVAVRAGRAVVIRVRGTSTLDAQGTLTAELLVVRSESVGTQ